MLKGFKDFILKGNVVELATAVIIGAAFTAIVKAFTDGIVQPIINAIPVGTDAAKGFGFQITDRASTYVDIGGVITAVINFLIIAAVVYFIIVMPYNKLSELGGFGKKSEVTEVALLTEIRDLLDPDGTSAAKEEAAADLPDHLADSGRPPSGAQASGSQLAAGAAGAAGVTQRISTQPPVDPGPPSGPQAPLSGAPASGPLPGRPYPAPQQPTPPPAPGSYPPPGNYPPGAYPPPPGSGPGAPAPNTPGTQYPGDYPPDAPGRHSR